MDQEVLDAIVEAADIKPTDHIVEIGPGIGVLTRELVKTARRVTAIELDARLIPLLEEFVGERAAAGPFDSAQGDMPALDGNPQTNNQKSVTNNLKVIQGNALHVPFPCETYNIVANIPYHITSPLLRHAFLESAVKPASLTLLLQREVAEKICDRGQAGMLTIIVALFGEPRIVRAVAPSSFLPPPEVDSAVLHIECFSEPLADANTIDSIFTLTKIAFGQKRKMLRNSIGKLPNGMELLETSGSNPERRPGTLTTGEWIGLAGVLRAHGTENA